MAIARTTCNACGKATWGHVKFCAHCGSSDIIHNRLFEVVKVGYCSACQREQKEGKFCTECGQPLEEKAQEHPVLVYRLV